MIVLAFETSTQLAGVAVIIDGHVVAEESSLRQKTHSEVISVFTENVLKKAALKLSEIDIFATGQGPGSFTGIRVAANTAKSFAYSFHKPLVTVDSLTLLAAQVTDRSRPVLSIINAYKNMVYFGLLDIQGPIPLFTTDKNSGPTAVSVRDLNDFVKHDVSVVGDGYLDYNEYFSADLLKKLHRPHDPLDYPRASTLGIVAEQYAQLNKTLDWNSFVPLYIRASEAEESKRGILIKPLT